ncbi:MAG: hypothetical protein DWI57_10030 [Chloroflexi bacterium]|nr:MAG: hypothetical protein DWI57_10030 [Chloroflexota bacterium]
MITQEALTAVRYVVNSDGDRTDVVIPWNTWREILTAWQTTIEGLENRENTAIPSEWLDRHESDFFNEHAGRSDMDAFRQILNREGGEAPRPGDELPE